MVLACTHAWSATAAERWQVEHDGLTDEGMDTALAVQKPKKKKSDTKDESKTDEAVDDDASEADEGDAVAEADAAASLDLDDVDADADTQLDTRAEDDNDGDDDTKPRRRSSGPAADMRGRLGIGALRTVSGLNGLTARYYLRDRFTLGLVGGVALFTHGETGDDGEFDERRSVGLMGVGTDAYFWPVQGDRNNQIYVDVGIGLRGMFYLGFDRLTGQEDDDDDDDTIDRPMEIDIEIPVAMQLFIGPSVALMPEFGAVVRIVPGSREADQQGNVDENPGTGIGEALGTTNGPGLGVELGSHAGMFMGLGVIYYFGAR